MRLIYKDFKNTDFLFIQVEVCWNSTPKDRVWKATEIVRVSSSTQSEAISLFKLCKVHLISNVTTSVHRLGRLCRPSRYNRHFRLELPLTAVSARNLRFSETSMLQDDVQRSQTTTEGDTKVFSELK